MAPPQRGITTEVRAIEEVPGGRRVTINVTQPVPLPRPISSLTLGFRAKARALVVLGIVDVAVHKVRTADIRRFTDIQSSRLIIDQTFKKVWQYEVIVQNEDYDEY